MTTAVRRLKAATKTTGANSVRRFYRTTNTARAGGGGTRGISTLMYAAQQGNVQVLRKVIRVQVSVPLLLGYCSGFVHLTFRHFYCTRFYSMT